MRTVIMLPTTLTVSLIASMHQQELKRDKALLLQRSIFSPLDGVVAERKLSPGDLMRADKSVVMTLARLDPLHVEVVLPAARRYPLQHSLRGALKKRGRWIACGSRPQRHAFPGQTSGALHQPGLQRQPGVGAQCERLGAHARQAAAQPALQ